MYTIPYDMQYTVCTSQSHSSITEITEGSDEASLQGNPYSMYVELVFSLEFMGFSYWKLQ
jgi:hypothetical protein